MKAIDNPYRVWRVRNFLTLAEIAALAGVSRQAVSRFEYGLIQSPRIQEVYESLMEAERQHEEKEAGENGSEE